MVCKSGCKKKCCDVTLINSDDINNAVGTNELNEGYKITEPGRYALCEDVDWNISETRITTTVSINTPIATSGGGGGASAAGGAGSSGAGGAGGAGGTNVRFGQAVGYTGTNVLASFVSSCALNFLVVFTYLP